MSECAIKHVKHPVGAGKGSARVLSVCAALPPVLPGPHATDGSLCSSRIASRPIRGALHGLRAPRHRTPRYVVVGTCSLAQCSSPSSQAPASVRRAKRWPTWLRSSQVRLTHIRSRCVSALHAHMFSDCGRAEDLVENLCKALVLFYLVPTPEDLNEWENEPENYFNEELRCARGLPSSIAIPLTTIVSMWLSLSAADAHGPTDGRPAPRSCSARSSTSTPRRPAPPSTTSSPNSSRVRLIFIDLLLIS